MKSTGYSALLPLVGRSYLPLAFFARLPLAMLTIGSMTLVTATTGSYAMGGLAAAMVGVGSAVGGPTIGYLADRLGQRRVLLCAAFLHTIMLCVLTWYGNASELIAPGLLTLISLLTGATGPQVGPMSRVRWISMTRTKKANPKVLGAALGVESMLDELGFVFGPVAVGFLASLLHPVLPLIIAAVLTAVLVPIFGMHRTERAVVPVPKNTQRVKATKIQLAAISTLVLGMIGLGTVFGASAAGTLAFAGAMGDSNRGGLLYGAVGLSSALAALSVALWPAKFKHTSRWIASASFLALSSILLQLPQSTGLMLLMLFIVGFGVGPIIVVVMTLGGEVAPAGRLSTVMTMLSAGIVVGTAIGNGVAGLLAESMGYAGAYWACTVAATVIALAAMAMKLLVRRSTQLQQVS
ncbi:MFS transporter [Glutamicibacter uratoxydans]|uniref:MFS transporter n=1 Tax=Glutamicibacter uratoxydans TaxID=43667 RepID=UPI003D6F2632